MITQAIYAAATRNCITSLQAENKLTSLYPSLIFFWCQNMPNLKLKLAFGSSEVAFTNPISAYGAINELRRSQAMYASCKFAKPSTCFSEGLGRRG